MAPRTGKHWMNRWSVWASLKIEAPTTLAETWVSWGNFLCIKSLLITSVQGSSYCWCPFTQHATISPGSHHGAGTESDGIPVYAIDLYGYFNRVFFFAIKPPPPQRTHTLWPFKDPWALNGGPWPFWHRDDPDPAHFPLSDTILSTLNEGVSGLKAYVILPSTCNRVDGEGRFCFFYCIKRDTFECNSLQPHASFLKSKHLRMGSLEKDFRWLCKLPEDTNWVARACMSTANNSETFFVE